MRVVLVAEPYIPVPPKGYGGSEQVLAYLIRGLQEAGHEPILLTTGDSTIDCERIAIADKALGFAQTRRNIAAAKARLEQAHAQARRALRRLAPQVDIIHSHGFDLRGFQAYPNVTTLHDNIEIEDIPYFRQRHDLAYVAISHNQQDAYPDLHYAGVAYNAEDPDAFPLVTAPDDYLCFLGRFDREKNPHLAIHLALNLGIKIKLAGKVDFRGEGYFEEEIAPFLNHPLVEYLGELDFQRKTELLAHAKCNLHPINFREAFGLTVLEAAYCGTPTLAIARGSMTELIEEGHTGILVEDFTEGYHKIVQCFAMDRRHIAEQARRRFTYRGMTDQYLQIYQRVIEQFKATRRRTAPKRKKPSPA